MGLFHYDDNDAGEDARNIGLKLMRIRRCGYAYQRLACSSSTADAAAKCAAKTNSITERVYIRRSRLWWVVRRTRLARSGRSRAGLIKLIMKKGLRLSRSRKLTLKPFSAIVFPNDIPSRIFRIYDDIVEKMKNMDGPLCHSYPHLIFSTQWGLPVLSHPLRIAKCMSHY